MDDPDQGVWTYTYYADGSLRSQKDANTQVVVNYYDKLGRMTSRVQPEGTSNWSYDTCTMGTGKLCSVTDNSGFTEIYTYNNLGLPHTTTTKISGQSDMVHSYTYDDKSRVETVTYPAGFKIKNHYNSLGFKEKVTDDKLSYSRGYVLWEAKEINAKGQVELFKQGSLTTTRRYNDLTGRLESQEVHRVGDEISSQTYKWLSNGNLDWKTDKWKGRTSEEITDYYGYDSLNRLTSTQTIVGSQQRSYVTLNYDALGNIKYKSDVGTYTYTGSGGPHAVSNITGKGSYTYDANGNMRTGDGRKIFYTSFNKPNKIKQNGNTTNITYGPDRKRYKRVDVNKSTIYYAGAYEKEIRNGATIHRVNIGDFAMMEIKSGVKYTFLNIRDHLGSLIGTVKNTNHHDKRYSFDPWGKRRTVGISYEMLQLDYTSMINAVTQRGFTGHEHLSNVGLIHMNGRVFDPEIGRFLSADPHIQAPTNLQSYNRYSYVLNNPLGYTDPSGYFFKKVFKRIKKTFKSIQKAWHKNWRTIVAVGLAAWGGWAAYGSIYNSMMAAGIQAGGGLASATINVGAIKASATVAASAVAGAASGAIVGATSAAFNGGSLRDILRYGARGAVTGAISGAAFGAAGAYSKGWFDKAIYRGIAGGGSSEMNGGKFKNGFELAGLLSLTGSAYSYIGREYNHSGKPHLWQEGKSDVGKQLEDEEWIKVQSGEMVAPLASDQSSFMKTAARGPYMDAFAEFHDGLHELPFVPKDQFSLIATMPHSYALTIGAALQPHTNLYIQQKELRYQL